MGKVAIIGSGFIGRAWAISFARAGHDVTLWDKDADAPGRARAYVAGVLDDLDAHDLLDGRAREDVLGRIRPQPDLQTALDGAGHIQENVTEDLDVKRAVFAMLDQAAPADAVIASSSSAILPSKFTEALAGRARCMVVHPINPPYLIPAVEVVPAPWTAAPCIARTVDLLKSAGHAPIVMKRELDGFVMNRLQGALLEEAFRLVDEGYASIEDVDIGIREGLALRWSFMGPFETIDLNAPGGVRDYVERYEGIYENIFSQSGWRAQWNGQVLDRIEAARRALLPADKLAQRQVWRDRRLIALAAHKKKSAREIGS
jgi:3-hydroxyacyl-CoA dehydrogenase